jgi:hypothetical protein
MSYLVAEVSRKVVADSQISQRKKSKYIDETIMTKLLE